MQLWLSKNKVLFYAVKNSQEQLNPFAKLGYKPKTNTASSAFCTAKV